jgi:hypothetical protein
MGPGKERGSGVGLPALISAGLPRSERAPPEPEMSLPRLSRGPKQLVPLVGPGLGLETAPALRTDLALRAARQQDASEEPPAALG